MVDLSIWVPVQLGATNVLPANVPRMSVTLHSVSIDAKATGFWPAPGRDSLLRPVRWFAAVSSEKAVPTPCLAGGVDAGGGNGGEEAGRPIPAQDQARSDHRQQALALRQSKPWPVRGYIPTLSWVRMVLGNTSIFASQSSGSTGTTV